MSLQEALAQHRVGDRNGAERLYRRALVSKPNDPEALHGFGWLNVVELRQIEDEDIVLGFREYVGEARAPSDLF